MKRQMQLSLVVVCVLAAQLAAAMVPTARRMAAFTPDRAAPISNDGREQAGFAYSERSSRPRSPAAAALAARNGGGYWADPTAEAKRIIALQSAPVDPEVDASPEAIMERWGYPWEKYDVITDDGYILALYRMPHSRHVNATPDGPRPVVFLMHGLECSSTNWITNLPNEAAGFIFADAGFDVWMGNFRGNTYSKRHVSLKTTDHEFWEFSWDQMAQYDLPAMINKALNVSGVDRLYYMGHSMGTLTAFAHFSRDQEFAKKIIKFYALGPVWTVKYIKGIFRWLAPFMDSLDFIFKLFGVDEFLPNSWVMDELAKIFCGHPISDTVCDDILFLFAGPDSNQMNVTRLPVYLTHTPAGTSTQNIIHFGQMVKSGKCEMYDWGKKENKARYKQDTPPEYDVSKMQVPIALYWGANDWLATPQDVENLIPKLQNIFDNQYLEDFNHLDFIWGLLAAPQAYDPILKDIKADFQSSVKTK